MTARMPNKTERRLLARLEGIRRAKASTTDTRTLQELSAVYQQTLLELQTYQRLPCGHPPGFRSQDDEGLPFCRACHPPPLKVDR